MVSLLCGRTWRRLGAVGGLIYAMASLGASAQNPAEPFSPPACIVQWRHDPADTNALIVEVSGLEVSVLKELRQADWTLSRWQRLLRVHAEAGRVAADAGLPAMLGSYRVAGEALHFEPQFPLARGVTYRAIFDGSQLPDARGADGKLVTATCRLPPSGSATKTVLSQVYPTAGVLPENLLKFYLHFSAPMSRGHIYDHIHLRDERGGDVELPFLELDEELWNPAMTRLTLFIDPGRIKRGVRPLEEVGPALQEGKRYTLVIDQAWKDAAGNPLKANFKKAFRAGSPDREPPDPARWKLRAPKSGTRQPVTLAFPKPMDHALAQRVIHVTTESGELVQGETTLHDEERRWRFVPDAPWHRGAHRVLVETAIEDLAGNNIGKPFEVDVFDEHQARLTSPTVTLPFEVR